MKKNHLPLILIVTILSPVWCQDSRPRKAEIVLGSVAVDRGIRCPEPQEIAFRFLSGETAGKTYRSAYPDFPYLYFDLSESVEWDPKEGLYITVEYYDGRLGELRIQYDSSDMALAEGPPRNHKRHWFPVRLWNTRKWETAVFHIEDPLFSGNQAGGCDFRLDGADIPIHRVEVTAYPPAGLPLHRRPDRVLETLPAVVPGSGVSFVVDSPWARWNGMSSTPEAHARAARYLRMAGVTSLQTYVGWADVCPEKGRYDWNTVDEEVKKIQEAGFRWVPILVLGPHWATPAWFTESDESQPYICLEHDEQSSIQSIWNPALRKFVDEFLGEFAKRYRETGIIDHVVLGISGNWGENYFPISGGFIEESDGHHHKGLWYGDPFAKNDFRRFLREKYAGLENLKKVWGEELNEESFTNIEPILPESLPAGPRVVDQFTWAIESMNRYAAYWAETARKHFPREPIYIAGGGLRPWLGSGGGSLARWLAPHTVGIRYGGQDGVIDPSSMFVSSMARFHGIPFGFEPAVRPDHSGEVGRMAGNLFLGSRHSSSRGWEYVTQAGEPEGMMALHIRQLLSLRGRLQPVPNTLALLLPTTSVLADESVGERINQYAARLRDLVEFDLLDEDMIVYGALERYRALLLLDDCRLLPETVAAIDSWLKNGGILLGFHEGRVRIFPDNDLPDGQWFGEGFDPLEWNRKVTATDPIGNPPDAVFIDIGGNEDGIHLTGSWNLPESAHWEWGGLPEAEKKRWTAGTAGFLVRLDPGKEYRMEVRAYVPSFAAPDGAAIRLHGYEIGTLIPDVTRTLSYTIPGERFGNGVSEMLFQVEAWRPIEYLDTTDTRPLGVAVDWIRIVPANEASRAGGSLPGPGDMGIRTRPDYSLAFGEYAQQKGKGWTLRGALPSPIRQESGLEVLVEALLARNQAASWSPVVDSMDGRLDGVLFQTFEDRVFCFNNTHRGVTIPEGAGPFSGTRLPPYGFAIAPLEAR